jgi:chemotaxis protein MotB
MPRRRGGGHGHHGGAWKVAYADFVTAMMAFFIVMWVLGMDTKTQQAISSYFNNPSATQGPPAAGGSPIGSAPGGGEAMTVIPIPMAAKDARIADMQTSLNTELAKLPEFADLQDSIDMRVDAEGLHIELIERADDMFFEKGKATLTERAVAVIQAIGRVLAGFPNHLAIEGHTDSLPYESGDPEYSNWELSADRANAARRVLESVLIDPNQISEVRGYADRLPRAALDTTNPSNRRVSILVRPMISEEAPAVRQPNPTAPSKPTREGLFPFTTLAGESSSESAATTTGGPRPEVVPGAPSEEGQLLAVPQSFGPEDQ